MANSSGHGGGAVSSICLSPDDEFFVAGRASGAVSLHFVGAGVGTSRTVNVHSAQVSCVNVPSRDAVFAGTTDGLLRRFRLVLGEEDVVGNVVGQEDWTVKEAHAAMDVTSVSSADGGRMLASGGKDSVVRLWDVERRRAIAQLSGHKGWVKCVKLGTSADGLESVHLILSGGRDKLIKLWDVRASTSKEVHSFRGHTGWIHGVDLCEGNGHPKIVSCSGDRTVRVWDLSTMSAEHVLRGHELRVWSVAVSRSGASIVSGSSDGTMRLWEMEAPPPAMDGPSLEMTTAPSPEGRIVHHILDGILAVDLTRNEKVAVCGAEDGSVFDVDLAAAAASSTQIEEAAQDHSATTPTLSDNTDPSATPSRNREPPSALGTAAAMLEPSLLQSLPGAVGGAPNLSLFLAQMSNMEQQLQETTQRCKELEARCTKVEEERRTTAFELKVQTSENERLRASLHQLEQQQPQPAASPHRATRETASPASTRQLFPVERGADNDIHRLLSPRQPPPHRPSPVVQHEEASVQPNVDSPPPLQDQPNKRPHPSPALSSSTSVRTSPLHVSTPVSERVRLERANSPHRGDEEPAAQISTGQMADHVDRLLARINSVLHPGSTTSDTGD